jgi:uncharacterized protein YycO
MVYNYEIDGLSVHTGDIICTTDGGGSVLPGQFWRLVGKFIPGDVDHIVIYIGPNGKCVEAGAKGVITFHVKDNEWDAEKMYRRRRIIDTLYGIAYPLKRKNFSKDREKKIRERVARYCLAQAKAKKPYNVNFFNSRTEKSFYCSQLAYKAYKKHKIDLNSGKGVPNIPGTSSIIFPQEIWGGCSHRRA